VALIEGLRGEACNSAASVLPSVKHYLADGATTWGSSRRVDRATLATDRTLAIANMGAEFVGLLDLGAWQIDQGDAEVDEATLRAVHLPPYQAAISAGALNVMVSYSSWKGLKMHAHASLVNDVLKGELAFPGFVVSDWEGIDQIGPDYDACVVQSINAGIDMVMVPFDYERFLTSLHRAVDSGEVTLARIDDAVRRILTAKVALGLFAHRELPAVNVVGSEEHRALAREAAGKSAVLLKNDGNVLPLDPNLPRLLVAGEAANDLGAHCGGWTVTWMGGHGAVTQGTTVLSGLRAELGADHVTYDPSGEGSGAVFPVGVVVLAEEPYAEGMGDRTDLRLSPEQLAVISRVRARCERLVVVLLSGRPLIVTGQLADWDAFVAGWLPGSEGRGLADVLLGLRAFTGRLSFDWPASMRDLPRRADSEALFRAGAGLDTGATLGQ
jgi:beta-glucosidase